ncbi:MAG: GNAT family N-acetyltransferase [Candidatus Cloacimonadota bacterium]|nr:GNAT family N-acetyltransferase [Candidatus Cloacimonadota bacterium]
MKIRIIEHCSISYWEEVRLRQKLLRTPLEKEFSISELQKERSDIHLGIFSEDMLLGCLIISPISKETVRLRQLAVLNLFQNQGLGKKLVLKAEEIAKSWGYSQIMLHSRQNVNEFYEKLGYKKVGNPFKKITLTHQKMVKKI